MDRTSRRCESRRSSGKVITPRCKLRAEETVLSLSGGTLGAPVTFSPNPHPHHPDLTDPGMKGGRAHLLQLPPAK